MTDQIDASVVLACSAGFVMIFALYTEYGNIDMRITCITFYVLMHLSVSQSRYSPGYEEHQEFLAGLVLQDCVRFNKGTIYL